jgi:hypothetical protein
MDLPEAYGLVPVVLNQCRQLVKQGYSPGLFVMEGFEKHEDAKKVPEGVILEPHVPFMHLYHYGAQDVKQTHDVDHVGEYNEEDVFKPITNFDRQVNAIVDALSAPLDRYDVVITHDIIYQSPFVVHNQAIRELAVHHPNIRWIHWMHSGPSVKLDNPEDNKPYCLTQMPMPNSVWVSPNDAMSSGFAEQYNVPRSKIEVVYHAFDVGSFFKMHDLSKDMIEKYDLLDVDVMCTWPTRIDHPEGKNINKAIWFMAQMNKLCDAKLVFLNSWSNTPEADNTIVNLRKLASEWGMPQENLIFSSEMGDQWRQGVPQEVVRDMLMISNLFIMPSKSETFSMAMIEAAACKNVLVLNQDLTVMSSLMSLNANYIGFGSEWGGVRVDRDYSPNAQQFFMDEAKKIYAQIIQNNPLMAQRRVFRIFNEKYIWKNQLQPLIEGE